MTPEFDYENPAVLPGVPVDELSTYGDTFDRFSSLVNSNWMDLRDKTNLRYGQVFFNTLFDMHPRLADDIRSTHRDPFHKDEVNMEIWDYCSEKWDTTARSI